MNYPPLPEEYVAETFVEHAEGAKRVGGCYIGGCPICHEGKSWGKKHRLSYSPKLDRVNCLNCGYKANGISFVAKVTGKPFREILKECKETLTSIDYIFSDKNKARLARKHAILSGVVDKRDGFTKIDDSSKQLSLPPLQIPYDSADILNDEFAIRKILKDGNKDSVDAVNYLKGRGLHRAINKGPLYLSKTDALHSNRIIIPFFNREKKLEFYQSRAYREKDKEIRYISSVGYHKNLYGIERVDFDKPYLFIQEGPLNCFFLKNSVAAGGINTSKKIVLTPKQMKEIALVPKKNIIWILDNQRMDKTAAIKIEILRELGYKVFDWPEIPGLDLHLYKDINEYCAKNKLSGLPEELFARYAK